MARERVEEARDRQRRRWAALGVSCNAHLPGAGRAPALFAVSRCGGAPHARRRDACAHGSRARSRDQGGPHRRRPGGLGRHRSGSPGRGALLPERLRDPGARPCRVSRRLPRRAAGRRGSVPAVASGSRCSRSTQLRGLRPLAVHAEAWEVGSASRDASSRFVAGGWAVRAIAPGCRRSTPARPPRASRRSAPGSSRRRIPSTTTGCSTCRIRRRASSSAGGRSPTASAVSRSSARGSARTSDGRSRRTSVGRSWPQGWSSCPARRRGSTRPHTRAPSRPGVARSPCSAPGSMSPTRRAAGSSSDRSSGPARS